MKTLAPRIATLKPALARTELTPGSWRTSNQGSNARGYTYAWQKARLEFLKKNPLCGPCQDEDGLITQATVVDHDVPHRGDPALFWDRSNWRPMCKSHHDRKTQLEGRQEADRAA